MSGGVDSSVAALLMQAAGYECDAVMLRLFDDENKDADEAGDAKDATDTYGALGANGAAGADGAMDAYGVLDAEGVAYVDNALGADGAMDADITAQREFAFGGDSEPPNPAYSYAREVAELLEIPFNILDLRCIFNEKVVNPFIFSYLEGATPNPCIHCNRHIKFGALLEYAVAQGFDRIATGHYARVEKDSRTGRYLLKKGADADKDQSYMLYSLTQRQLSKIVFPLGGYLKRDVRTIAESRGFQNAKRRESQDICFIPDGCYADFITRRTGKKFEEGPIADMSGVVVGRHKGAIRYTVGQRKGLGLAMPEPVYVYAKSMAENKIFIGYENLLFTKTLIARDINLIPFPSLGGSIRAAAKTRYRQPEQPATIEQISDNEIRVEFDAPQRAITCGQAVVFYDGDTVIGGGIIDRSG